MQLRFRYTVVDILGAVLQYSVILDRPCVCMKLCLDLYCELRPLWLDHSLRSFVNNMPKFYRC